MNVVALHKNSLAVVNIISVDSITKSGSIITVHGIATTGNGTAATYNFDADAYLISIVAN